jgi:hypothetical protein
MRMACNHKCLVEKNKKSLIGELKLLCRPRVL